MVITLGRKRFLHSGGSGSYTQERARSESAEKSLCFGDGVEFAHIEQLQLRVEVTLDFHLVANGQVEVDDGELAFP